jgi:CheY-like chemotaxis protein
MAPIGCCQQGRNFRASLRPTPNGRDAWWYADCGGTLIMSVRLMAPSLAGMSPRSCIQCITDVPHLWLKGTFRMTKHILLVDDTIDILRLLRMMLEEHNHQVSVLDSGRGVVEFVRLNKPDLIVLDLRLGEESGIPVLRALKTNPDTAAVPVVVYTASLIDAEKTQKMIASEPETFVDTRVLQKPFALDELLSIIA